jgi:5-methyltetrahydrofolate--homocysteine methyltransferase
MVPAQKILEAAAAENADMIGLSGLITPSLDEMVNFASEMERQGLDLPLLIGGATTSRAHTAVKVDPKYHGPVVWVKDASRSVPVASALLSDQQRPGFMDEVKADFDSIRERHAARNQARPLTSLERARENASPIDWSGYRPPKPRMLARQDKDVWSHGPAAGSARQFVRVFHDYDLAELRPYIDWQPFFNAWEMRGKFPDILNNPASGEAARKLWDEAQELLDRVIEGRWLRANGVVGLFPANRVDGEDIEVYADESRTAVLTRLHHLRQQGEHRQGLPHRSIADFVAPKETGIADFVGGFAVTAGLGAQEKVLEFKAALDDYNAILVESLADRLAEAFAERLHERVRKELWGYAPDEHLDNVGLIKEQYAGIRPAPGYPACPDHTEKATLWSLLDVEANTGITLTDSMAMWPGAAVSGFYLSHPESQYFVLGRLGQDQVADYARRKGWTLKEAERWLAPNLGYEPED